MADEQGVKRSNPDEPVESSSEAPLGKQAKTGHAMDDIASCPVCRDLYYEPQTLHCGHSLCIECSEAIRKQAKSRYIACPECKSVSDAHPNYALARVVEKTFPDEWARRKQECELLMWFVFKERAGLSVNVIDYQNDNPDKRTTKADQLRILQALDKIDIWSKESPSASVLKGMFGHGTALSLWTKVDPKGAMVHEPGASILEVRWKSFSLLIVKRPDVAWISIK